MKRIVFMGCIMSMVCLSIAYAEVPTTVHLKAYQAFKTPPEYTGDDILKKMNGVWAKKEDDQCFAGHVCAAEGTIGLSLDCERDLSICLYRLETEGMSSDPNSSDPTCTPFFKAMTPVQNAMIGAPKGCEVPPPPSAVQATMTPGEAQCIADRYCTEQPDLVGWEALCRKEYDACARSLSEMDVSGRALCRKKRVLSLMGQTPHLSPNGPCRPEMSNPVLATAPRGPNSNSPAPSKSHSSEKKAPAESGQKTDEFDLGDLDF